MRIDVLIEYDHRFSRITFSSKATRYCETRASNIGLSRPEIGDFYQELVEFIGEAREDVEILRKEFSEEPTRKGCVMRIINPFEPATFEPLPAFQMISHFSHMILAHFYPRTWLWRMKIPFITTYDLTLKVPGYNFFNPLKKAEFENLLRRKFKKTTFVS